MQATAAPLDQPRPARWTREEYAAMAAAGVVADRRVQLLDGEIVEMPPMLNPHVRALRVVRDLLLPRLPVGGVLEQQVPLARGLAAPWIGGASDPEPDAAVYLGEADAPPSWALEISDTTLGIDRGRKLRIYARASVAVYWVLDLNGRALHVYTEPVSEDYGALRTHRRGVIHLPWAADPINLADLLP
jgi:Uma2 family endonuclease